MITSCNRVSGGSSVCILCLFMPFAKVSRAGRSDSGTKFARIFRSDSKLFEFWGVRIPGAILYFRTEPSLASSPIISRTQANQGRKNARYLPRFRWNLLPCWNGWDVETVNILAKKHKTLRCHIPEEWFVPVVEEWENVLVSAPATYRSLFKVSLFYF